MKRKPVFVLGGVLLTALGAVAIGAFFLRAQEASGLGDPRQEPPVVRLVTAVQGAGSERGFTGIIAARVQSNLGFRVAGKIVERLVTVGQQVKAGQALIQSFHSALICCGKALASGPVLKAGLSNEPQSFRDRCSRT